MLSFSIDSLTGDAATYRSEYPDTRHYYSTRPGYPSQLLEHQMKSEYPDILDSRTPSPTDSGIDGSFTPTADDDSYNDIEKVLSKLSKKSEALVKPEDSHDKPPHAYIALITMAIQSCPDRKLVLSDIYRYVMDNFPYYNNGERAWRNSIRYTLSINDCFTKAGPSDCGKGNYWAVHPAVADDFAKGDYRRRQSSRRSSRRKVKSSSGDIDLSTTRTTSALSVYHPYSTVAYYPRTTYPAPVCVPAATDRQQTTHPATPGYSPSTTTPTGTTSLVYTPNRTTSPAYMPNVSPSPGYTPNATTSPGYTPNATSPGYTPNATSPGYTPNATTPPGYMPNATTSPGYTPNDMTPGYTSGYSDFYKNYYGLSTSQPTPSYDIMTSKKYDYTNTSGFNLPANQSYVW